MNRMQQLLRGRPATLIFMSIFLPILVMAAPVLATAFGAAASVAPTAQYLGDSTGTVFTFTIHNTGDSASIGAVQIERPSTSWTVVACPQAPAGWTTQVADTMCRYRSAEATADDIQPGQSSSAFQLKATVGGGQNDLNGTWKVTVSKSNQFDNKSLLLTAAIEPPGLTVRVHSFEILDAVVATGPATPGSACPAPNKEAISGSTVTIVICGKNRTNTDLTPTIGAFTSLGGTFIGSPGTFSSGKIAKRSASSVVLGNWTGATVTSSGGTGKTIDARIGSAANRTSPLTTLNGYEAKNQPPTANADSHSVNEDAILTQATPGVLTNDTDPDGDPLTAVLVTDVTHGTLTLNADGSFTYTPEADFNDSDSFTYKAKDPFGAESAPATVTITVDPVNDLPEAVNDSYTTDEDMALNDDVLANDTDVDGDPLNAVLVTGPANGALTLNANGSFNYTPAANYHGSDSFTYKANDGAADSNIATVSITVSPVNDAPTAANDSYTTSEDTTINVAAPGVLANDSDTENDALTAVLVSGPAHGTLTLNANGSLTYTPAANYHGADSFTYKANDGAADSTVASVSITVNSVNDTPAAVNDSYTTNEDTTLNVPVPGVLDNDTDGDGDTLNAILVSGPAHGTLTLGANGSFSYTPSTNYFGQDSFTYKANDGAADSNVATATITVNAVNDAPVAANDSYTTDEDTPLDIAAPGVLANDSDADTDALSASSSINSPSTEGGSVTLNSDGSFTYTPAANFWGVDTFTYTVSDGNGGTDTATVTITVDPVNDTPVAVNDGYSTNEDTGLTVPADGILTNDTDNDGDSLFAVEVSPTTHGHLTLNPDGSFTYEPDANYSGPDSFTYKANDGAADSNVATVNLTVHAVNDAPVANDDAYSAPSGSLTVNLPGVLANDSDAENSPLTAVLVAGPSNAQSFSLNTDGSFTYTANAGATTDSFTYKANDGTTDSTVATVTITSNAQPTANPQSVATDEDTPLTITLTGSDAEDAALTFSIVTGPDHGTLVPNGAVDCSAVNTCSAPMLYTPGANYHGEDSFTFTVNDGQIDSASASVSITVNSVNDPPTAVNDSYSTNEDTPFTASGPGVLSNDTHIDGGPLTASLVTNASHGTVALNSNGDFTYTPNANYNGQDSFTYKANDGSTDSNVATVSLTVNAVNDGPTNNVPGAQTVNEDTALVFSSANGNAISVSDVDAAAGAIQVTLNATNATLTPASGSGATVTGSGTSNVTLSGTLTQVNAALNGLSYLGVSNFNETRGASVVSITTDDQGNTGSGGALSDADTVAVTVEAVNDSPVAQAKSYNAQANMKINGLTGLLAGATDPDSGDGGYTASFTVGTVGATTPAGGTISNLNTAAGSFDFDPPPGASGDVTFTYTVCDTGNPAPPACSAPATVTVSVAGPVIWFVNPAAVVNGNGRLSSPFNVLSSVDPVDAANHRVFLYTGTASTGLALNSGEWLIGQGVSGSNFDSVMGIAPPSGTIARPSIAGTRPTVQGTVTLESNAVVKGLNLSTGASTGLADPAAAISGVTVSEVSVISTLGTAVNLSSAGGTISLTSVTSNGGTNGIVLNNTTGTFNVTGTGSAGTGGTIQNKATGISLTSAANVSLSYMQLNDFTDYAIRGTTVNGFTLANSVVSGVNGNDAASDEGSIRFTDLTGVAAVTSTNISGGFENNFKLNNSTGTLNRLTFTSVTIGANSTSDGNDGIGIEGSGGATVNVTVQNSTFTSARGDLFQMNHIGTGTADLIFTGNTLSNNHPSIATGGGGVTLGNGSTSTFTMNLSTNTFRDAVGHAVLIVKDVGTGSQSVTFTGNTVGVAAVANSGSKEGSDLKIQHAGGGGTQTVRVSSNFFYQYNNDAVLLQTGAGAATNGTFNATVTGNVMSNAGNNPSIGLPVQGINLNGGVTPGDTFAICADIGGAGALANNLAGAVGPFGGGDYRLRQRQSTTVRLPGYGGGATDTAAVTAFVNGRNIVSGSGTAAVNSPPGGGFAGGAACPQP